MYVVRYLLFKVAIGQKHYCGCIDLITSIQKFFIQYDLRILWEKVYQFYTFVCDVSVFTDVCVIHLGVWSAEESDNWLAEYLHWLWRQNDSSLSNLVLSNIQCLMERDFEVITITPSTYGVYFTTINDLVCHDRTFTKHRRDDL